jgi:hypothetical protein
MPGRGRLEPTPSRASHETTSEADDLAFEPEGAEHLLREEDLFRVEAVPPPGEAVEIAYHDGGISIVYAERAFNKASEELRL